MADIVRIIIKGASGYGPIEEAYEDKIVITSSSISYEYKPHPESNSKRNFYRKWSYKTTSPMFKEIYGRIAKMTPYYLYNREVLFVTDIGPTIITATFDDKHRETVNYFCPNEFFEDYFRTIKRLVPACERTPAVLLTSEDFEDAESDMD